MKFFAKFLLVGTVAVMAIAVSAAPSEAAKKKEMKAPGAGTYAGSSARSLQGPQYRQGHGLGAGTTNGSPAVSRRSAPSRSARGLLGRSSTDARLICAASRGRRLLSRDLAWEQARFRSFSAV